MEFHFGVLTIGRSASLAGLLVSLVAGLFLAFSPSAEAIVGETRALPDGTQQTTYRVGPLDVTSGQNRIAYKPMSGADRPAVDGWITRIQPNLTYANGTIPSSSKVMFHHGVWLNASRPDATYGGPQRFFATGEEKTNMDLPAGYGYEYKTSDVWILNHMIHNLIPDPMELYITYTVDFIPASAPQAASIKPVRPIWLDVENGGAYPVFDVHRDTGGSDGEFTYPAEADNPYGSGPKKNEWTVDEDGVLLGTTGHVHTGGLNTELFLRRDGASYGGPICDAPPNRQKGLRNYQRSIKKISSRQKKVKRALKPGKVRKLKKSMPTARFKSWKRKQVKKKSSLRRSKSSKLKGQKKLKAKVRKEQGQYKACTDTQPNVEGNRVRLFESDAHYFGNRAPVSWDVAMRSTKSDWRVRVNAGDTLELQTTYETKIASWFESMGINVLYMSNETDGDDPYVTKVDGEGVLNHGHYDENNDHGGTTPVVGPDPTELPSGLTPTDPVSIGDYFYEQGDFRLPGAAGRPPAIEKGKSFTFELAAGDAANEIWHSVTSCKAPCNKSTGISYPIPDGEFQFDSGQLGNLGGNAGPPTVGRTTWSTPANLPVGTHTYFCRIHPLMRGAFRVVDPKSSKNNQ